MQRRDEYQHRLNVRRAAAGLIRPSAIIRANGAKIRDVLNEFGVTDARLVGSIARGDDRPGSDIDMIVTLPPGADIVDLLALEEALSDLLTVRVDVVSSGSSGIVDHVRAASMPL